MPRGKPGTGKAALVRAANPIALMQSAVDALLAVPKDLRPYVIDSATEPKRRKRRKSTADADTEPVSAPAPKKAKKKAKKSKKADLLARKKERAAELETEE